MTHCKGFVCLYYLNKGYDNCQCLCLGCLEERHGDKPHWRAVTKKLAGNET